MQWLPLLWKNLPSHPHVAPAVSSPYHHRLDWQVWIHTTARLEAAALAGHVLPVPDFVDTLIKKILAGDTDAIDLTGTRRADLLGTGPSPRPPTGIKAQYFWFNFTSNSSHSDWWLRSDVRNNGAIIWTRADDRWPSARSSALYRRHLLCVAAVSAALALLSTYDPALNQRQRVASAASALVFLVAFAATLLCPAVPVAPPPPPQQSDASAAAALLLSYNIVAVWCSCMAAVACMLHKQGVIKATPPPCRRRPPCPHPLQVCTFLFVLLNVSSSWA